MTSIIVCIKQVPATTAEKRYTDDLRLDRAAAEAVINPLDEYAIEQALRLQEAARSRRSATCRWAPSRPPRHFAARWRWVATRRTW